MCPGVPLVLAEAEEQGKEFARQLTAYKLEQKRHYPSGRTRRLY